jgi:demethylmenaquinone methyltransferase/2-methoxy-6-polyprenyl-1,4-benzoquinol methylase
VQHSESQEQGELLRVLRSKEETRAFYDKISSVYDLLAERSEGPVRQAGLDKLAVTPGEHVLEIGFGTGHCVVQMAEAVGREGKVFGVDLSEGMRAQAQDRLEKAHLMGRAELVCGDATDLPYPDGSMDAIFMSFTLELFDTPEIPQVLSECKRVLRVGGRIGVVAITKEGEDGFAIEAYEWTHRHFPNLLDCRPIFVRRALDEAGFLIKDATIAKMWVPVEIVVGEKVELTCSGAS